MAEETKGIDLGNINLNNIKTINEMLSDAASGQPSSAAVEAKNNYYSISDDPLAPLVEIPKNLSPEEVDAYLASDELQAQIFNQGFLYIPGTAARKIEAPTMEDKGAFSRGFGSIMNIIRNAPTYINNTFQDIIGNEDYQVELNSIIKQYETDAAAKSFFTTEDGELRPFAPSLEDIFTSGDEGKIGDLVDYVSNLGGQMSAAAIPQAIIGLALKFTPAGRAIQFTGQAVTSAAALGLPLVLGKQLEETDDPNAAVTLVGSSVFGAVEAALGLPSRVITGAVKKKIGEQAFNNWARSFVTGGTKSGALEATAEILQDTTIETAGATERVDDISELPQELSKTFSDPVVLKNLREAGYGGFIGGFLFGGPVQIVSDKRAKQAYESAKKFEGTSKLISTTNFNDPKINEYKGQQVTLNNLPSLQDKEGNTILDKDGKPATPKFVVIGTTDIDGEKHVVLINTSDKTEVPSTTIPLKEAANLLSIYTEPEVVEKTEVNPEAVPDTTTTLFNEIAEDNKKNKRKIIGVTEEQGELIAQEMRKGVSFEEAVKKHAPGAAYMDFNKKKETKPAEVIEPEEETFVNHNKNTVKAAERRLLERGYSKKTINSIYKKPNGNDDIISLADDEMNYIDDLRSDLENLNYYKGPEGIAKIDRLQEDVAKGKRGKTRGRELLEDIVKSKIAFQPVEVTNKYRSGEKVVPPLSREELQKAGYTVSPIEYTKAAFEKDIISSRAELDSTTDVNERSIIERRIRYLKSLYNISGKPLENRYNTLRSMITGKGYTFRDSEITKIGDLPAQLKGVQDALDGTLKNNFLSDVEKRLAVSEFTKRLDNILQDQSDFDVLLISLGATETIPLNELSKISMGNPIISKITKDVKGKIIPQFEKETTMQWSLQGDSPKMKDSFKGDLPKLREQLVNELQRLMGLGPNDLEIVNNFLTNTGEALNGGFLIDFATVDVATRMRTIATLLNSGVPIEQATLVVPQIVPQNKIIISTNANEPFAFNLKQDPRLFTLHHETMHALMVNGFFTKEETKVLKDAAKNYWIKQYDISNRPGVDKLTQEQLQEEAIANAFAGYMANKYQPRGFIATLFYRLKAYFNSLANVLFNNTYTDANEIFEQIDLGRVKKRKYNAEVQSSLDLSYRNAAYIAGKKIKDIKNQLETSAVKGGTAENVGLVGVSTQNKAGNILLNSPAIRNAVSAMTLEASRTSPELGLAIDKIYNYVNHLTGNQNETGLPTVDDIIEMDNLIVDTKKLLKDIDYRNYTGAGLTPPGVNRATLSNSLNRLRQTLTTPQQKDAMQLLTNLIYTNSGLDSALNSTQRGRSLDIAATIFATRLTEQNVALANSPVIMYHGSKKEFEVFKRQFKDDFFYHTGSLVAANIAVGRKADASPSIIMKLLPDIKNPLRMKDIGTWDADTILNELNISDTRGRGAFSTKKGVFVSSDMEAAITGPDGVVDYELVNILHQQIFTPEETLRLKKAFKREEDIIQKLKEADIEEARKKIDADDLAAQATMVRKIEGQYNDKLDKAKDERLVNALKKKGYDGIVYLNLNEASSIEGGPRDSYIAFNNEQLIPAKEIPADYDLGSPLFRASLSSNQDPSATDSTLDEFPEMNRQQENQSIRIVDRLVEDYRKAYDGNVKQNEEQVVERLNKYNKIATHIRIWAANNPIFAPLYNTVKSREQFTTSLQFQLQQLLSRNYQPAMKDTETNINLTKALEISAQVPGRYTPDRPLDQGGRITFVAKENGRGAGSTVKAGDIVVLQGDAAQAYLDVQEAMQMANKEIIRGLMANENVTPMLTFAIGVIKANRPDLANITFGDNQTPIVNYNEEQIQNMEYDEVKFIVDALKDPATYLQPNNKYSPELAKVANSVLSKESTERDADGSIIRTTGVGTGLNALVQELFTYKTFKQNDYVPLQRYGNYFIAVKDADGNVIEYRMFNKGKFFGKFLNEEDEVRKQLKEKYPNINIDSLETREVDIQNLRQGANADLSHMDSIAQFLSDLNANNYIDVRKELETLINKKVGADIRGYGVFLKPRKEQGGVPGFSIDFGRAISQYLTLASGFAGKNRFKTTEIRLLNDVKQSGKKNLRDAVTRWYEYSDDPYQEFALPRRLGFWWYLGGNISSALLQTMSIPQFVFGKLGTFSNTAIATKELMIGLNDARKMLSLPGITQDRFEQRTLQDIFMDFSKAPEDVKQDYLREVANGIVKPGSAFKESGMPTDQVNYRTSNRIREGLKTAENTIMGGAFATMETFSRTAAYIASYRLFTKNKKAREKAHKYFMHDANYRYSLQLNNNEISPRTLAQFVIEEDFGVYGKTERPAVMRGPGSVVFLFNTYVAQMLSQIFRNLTDRGLLGKEMAAKSLVMIGLTGGLFAVPFFDDAAWLAEFIYNTVTGIRTDRRQVVKRFFNDHGFGSGAIEAMENGLVNKWLGFDLSSRVRFNVPGIQQTKAFLNMAGLNSGARGEEILGAFGSMTFGNARGIIDKVEQAGGLAQLDGSDYMKIIGGALPTFMKNLITATDYYTGGPIFSGKGTLLIDNPTAYQGFLKTIGFNPTEIAKAQQLLYLEKVNGGVTAEARKRFNTRIKNYYRDLMINRDNPKELAKLAKIEREIIQDLIKFNSNLHPGLKFSPNVYRLMQEAMKDVNKIYRISGGSTYEIMSNLQDYQISGMGLLPAKPY
jgi:hypothetical protein